MPDAIWQASLLNYKIGHFNLDTCRGEPIDNPFDAKVLPMSSE